MPPSQKVHDEVKRQMQDWLISEQLKFTVADNPHENNAFEIKVEYPRNRFAATVMIVRPDHRRGTVFVIQVKMADEHLSQFQDLSASNRNELIHRLRLIAFGGGDVGFGPKVEDGMLQRWTIDYLLYDDALNEHTFNLAMRKVFTKHLELLEVLGMHLGSEVSEIDTEHASGPPTGYI